MKKSLDWLCLCLNDLGFVPGCTWLYPAEPGCTRLYPVVPGSAGCTMILLGLPYIFLGLFQITIEGF